MKSINPIHICLILLIVILTFAYSFTPIRSSNDVWWHLKSGKYIIEHNVHLPENDVFTYTGENFRWINHEWLTQVLMYGAYMWGNERKFEGLRTVIFCKTLLLIASFLIVFLTAYRRSSDFYLSVFFSLIAAAVARRTFFPRPPVFTYLFFALFLFLIYEYRAAKIKSLPFAAISLLLMVLWVNLHGGFVIGLVVFAFFLIDSLFNPTLRETVEERNRVRLNLALLFLGLIIASLINPYGIHTHLLTFKVMGKTNLVRIIPELRSPEFFFVRAYEFLILFFLAGFMLLKRRVPSFFELAMLLFFLHQSINHVRHLPLFAIASAPFAAWLGVTLARDFKIPKSFVAIIASLLTLLFTIDGVFHHREEKSYFERNFELINGTAYIRENYPTEACDFIITNNFNGHMFNQINFAGYIIWRLSPERHKVFTDSRYDIWGDTFLWDEKYIEGGVTRNPPGKNWYDLVDKYDINFILITRDAHLNRILQEDDEWVLVYWWIHPESASPFGGWNIYVKNVPENKALIERCKASFQSLLQFRTLNAEPTT